MFRGTSSASAFLLGQEFGRQDQALVQVLDQGRDAVRIGLAPYGARTVTISEATYDDLLTTNQELRDQKARLELELGSSRSYAQELHDKLETLRSEVRAYTSRFPK